MSRIGNKAIVIPAGVTVNNSNNVIAIKGPKGELSHTLMSAISAEVDANHLVFKRANDEKHTKQMHGTTRAIVQGMITGVTAGYSKKLIIKGIGYRANMEGANLKMMLGYSHPKLVTPLPGVKIEVKSPTEIIVSGIDKQAVGQTAALVRACREPEPYKEKGVAYDGEKIRRKEGKKAGKK